MYTVHANILSTKYVEQSVTSLTKFENTSFNCTTIFEMTILYLTKISITCLVLKKTNLYERNVKRRKL